MAFHLPIPYAAYACVENKQYSTDMKLRGSVCGGGMRCRPKYKDFASVEAYDVQVCCVWSILKDYRCDFRCMTTIVLAMCILNICKLHMDGYNEILYWVLEHILPKIVSLHSPYISTWYVILSLSTWNWDAFVSLSNRFFAIFYSYHWHSILDTDTTRLDCCTECRTNIY